MKDLRQLVGEEPELFKTKVFSWLLKGGTLKSLAEELDVAYPTLQRVCKDLGLQLGKSVLATVSSEDWATKSKKQIGEERLITYQNVYNYYHYHKAEIDDGIRAWRKETLARSTLGPQAGLG